MRDTEPMNDAPTAKAFPAEPIDFRITKMAVIDGWTNTKGNRLLASFTVLTPGLRVGGCVLIEKEGGRIVANGPRGKTPRGHPVHVSILDEALQKAVTDRAAKLYEGLTGRVLGEP